MSTRSPRSAVHGQAERETVNLMCTHGNQIEKPVEYTTSAHFSKLFAEDMTRLYPLSSFLTANHGMAERCFVCGFGDCIQRNLVFQKCARSWSRRMIIHNAMRMMSPHPRSPQRPRPRYIWPPRLGPIRIRDEDIVADSVLSLGTFEQFVFVLFVLERYPDQNCSSPPGLFAKRRSPKAGMRVPATRGLAIENRCVDPRSSKCRVSGK
jgi:hypothetical protein